MKYFFKQKFHFKWKKEEWMGGTILIVLIISYSILIAIQISISKELMEIKKILWKVAEDESLEFTLEKSKKDPK